MNNFFITYRRFGPNLVEISDELGQVLGPQFYSSDLPEYAALCWLAAAKCEQDLENKVTGIDYLIKAGNAFVRANDRATELFPSSNAHEHRTGAVRCYKDALTLAGEDSAMGAGIIRLLKKVCPATDKSSQFHSPTHRIYDLEKGARRDIHENRYMMALEQLTEICEILQEDKSEEYYQDTLAQVQVLLLLLLLTLQLPPGRQSPIHMKILNRFHASNANLLKDNETPGLTHGFLLALQNLSFACDNRDGNALLAARRELMSPHHSANRISLEHSVLLEELAKNHRFSF